jgi:hypothetical protein
VEEVSDFQVRTMLRRRWRDCMPPLLLLPPQRRRRQLLRRRRRMCTPPLLLQRRRRRRKLLLPALLLVRFLGMCQMEEGTSDVGGTYTSQCKGVTWHIRLGK